MSIQASFVGWKAANLLATLDGKKLAFNQVHRDGSSWPYQIEASAKCNYWDIHKPPVDDCKCGFSAYRDQLAALRYRKEVCEKHAVWRDSVNLVVLRVRLYGKLLEESTPYTQYRGSHQKVEAIFLPKTCAFCTERAATTTLSTQTTAGRRYAYLQRTCWKHASLKQPVLTPTKIAHIGKVEVGWL